MDRLPNKPTRPDLIRRRDPNSLKLEVAMMRALIDQGYSPKEIAAWIAAQRRDGLLSASSPPWLVESEMVVWTLDPPNIVNWMPSKDD